MNKVIIIGGDHYNALGLARVFGVNGVKPYGLLISYSKPLIPQHYSLTLFISA